MESLRNQVERYRLALLALIVGALFVQTFLTMRDSSVTWDEHAFVGAGYSYVATGDFRLNREQPPLMKLLFGLPGLVLQPDVPTDHESWTGVDEGWENTEWEFGRHFLTGANDNGMQLVFWSRMATVLVTCLLCVVVYAFARSLYGTVAGLLASLLVATSPNIIGHGGLATTDVGVTAFVVLAVFLYWRFYEEPTRGRLVAAGLGFGLALLAKFSGVFLLPMYGLWALVCPWLDRRGEGGYLQALRRIGPGTAIIVVIGLALTSIAYLAPGRVDLYFRNMLTVGFNVNEAGEQYLLGTYSPERFPAYFLVAFLVKTSGATLLLLLMRLLANPAHRGERARDLLLLFTPIAVFFFVISWKAPNIGVRYILPVYPFIFIYISGIVRAPLLRRDWARGAVALVAAYAVVVAVRIHPHQISYFNDFVGGPARGIEYLEDSNVDWGQDLIRLSRYLEEQDIGKVRVLYSKIFDFGMYGIDAELMPPPPMAFINGVPGTYVLGVKEARRVRRKLADGSETSLLELREPTARIGYSLNVYTIE